MYYIDLVNPLTPSGATGVQP